ncbi:MAG: replicative DNA helicase [Verrucomicrobia bacterium]|nr:replicative DNA helicase [Verrucomicrobiota bacterium]
MMKSETPESQLAEKAVLGAAISDPRVADSVLEALRPDQFFWPAHQQIAACLATMREAAQPVDMILLTTELEKIGQLPEVGGIEYITEIATDHAVTVNWRHYAAEVLDRWRRRALRAAATRLAEAAADLTLSTDDALERCDQEIFRLRDTTARDNPVAPCKEAVLAAADHIETVYRNRGGTTGLSTGIHDLDRSTGGFLGGQMIVIAARPACGKSALGMQIALHAALEKAVPTLVFSVEMPSMELMCRALCSEASINLQRVRDGYLRQEDLAKVSQAATRLIRSKLFLDDTPGLSVAQFRARARRAKAQHNIGLIVVDYLQFMVGSGKRSNESRALEVSEISKSIKTTAKELNIPVIALAQLNRDADEGTKPKLSNLRESGSIEQDADTVLLIHRLDKGRKRQGDEEESDHNTLLILAKQRNGPTPEIKLNFIGEHTVFQNLTEKLYSNNQSQRQK